MVEGRAQPLLTKTFFFFQKTVQIRRFIHPPETAESAHRPHSGGPVEGSAQVYLKLTTSSVHNVKRKRSFSRGYKRAHTPKPV